MTNGTAFFDQRPGALEATRPAGRLSALGVNTPDGWRVGLVDGAGVLSLLSIADAMGLAIELSGAADVLAGRWGAVS